MMRAATITATGEKQPINTSIQPINTSKQPIKTSKQHINTFKQPINTAPHYCNSPTDEFKLGRAGHTATMVYRDLEVRIEGTKEWIPEYR